MKYIKYFFLTSSIICLLYFIAGELFLPSERMDSFHNYQVFEAEWTWVKSDGTQVPIKIPGKYDARENEKVTIQTVLPDNLKDNTYLSFKSLRQDMKIYVDDVLRQEFSTKDTRLFGSTSSTAYIFFEFKQEDSGKILKVVTQTDSSSSGAFRTIYYGDKLSLWKQIFDENAADIIVSFFMLLLGIITIIVSVVIRFCYQKDLAFLYLGFGITVGAAWLLLNSAFRQILFPNISIASDVTFFCIMLLPFPFLLFMNDIQEQRYEKCYLFSGIFTILINLSCLLLYVTDYKDFSETIFYLQIACITCIFSIGIATGIDLFKGYIEEYKLIAIGILGSCVAALIQIFLYYKRFSINFSGIMLAIGLIFLLICASIATAQEILSMERERRIAIHEKRKAIEASRAKSNFLAQMSHEIRTPINAVLGLDEMILRESNEEHITEYATDIQNAGRSLLSLINDILDLSKIESGKLEIIPVKYQLSTLLNDCYDMTSIRAKDKNLSFEIKVDPTIPNNLFGDEFRLRQIILNLLSNAIKYTLEGTVTLSVEGKNTNSNEFILDISVSDTGIGIKPENQEKLFYSFERIEESKNRNIEGTGLGLSITKHLLTLMGGIIYVKSEYGKGSTFYVRIPQTILSEEVIGDFSEKYTKASPKNSLPAKNFHAPDGHILVVDDIEINLKVFTGLLKNTWLHIDTAASGAQCLEKITKKHYDIIFLDHLMPEMDGIETLQAMKEVPENKNQTTPVIVLTANAIMGAKEEYLNAGFIDYLSKPMRGEDLENMILKYLPNELILEPEDESHKEDNISQTKTFLEQLSSFLDTKTGLNFCMNDEDFYKEVLNTYLDKNQLTVLQTSYDEKDLKTYQIQVHSVKSTSLSIGATKLSNDAKQLEMAAKENDFAYIEKNHEPFMISYKKLLEQLKIVLHID